MNFRLFGKLAESVFELNGSDENSATYSLGWCLSRCPIFLELFGSNLIGEQIKLSDARIDLQRHGADLGFTDIEIQSPSCHILIEAKRYWELPTKEQLKKYSKRINMDDGRKGLIVSLSAASQEYASGKLSGKISSIPLLHRSWGDVCQIVRSAYSQTASFEEKFWLQQLEKHLKGYVSMQNSMDNNVFVVSLSSDVIKEGDPYTWVDVVEKNSCYFHGVGSRWPITPPNYIGFRLHGKLLSVHHIDDYKIVTDVSSYNSHWPKTEGDHYVYTLGPEMRPITEIKNGRIWNAGHYWCAIDTLLSGAFKTISEARDETNRRQEPSDN